MTDKSYVFEKLTPVDDADISVYENAINFVFDNEDIKNVAISGAYGAGKSSLLASYKKKYNNRNFIHISLVHFKQISANKSTLDNQNSGDDNVDIAELEGKILNQLIHQIQPEKIEQTHFKIKRTIKKEILIRQTAEITVFVLALLHIILWSAWSSYVHSLDNVIFRILLFFTTCQLSKLISGLIVVVLAIWFCYNLVKMQNNKNLFKKLNVQGNEIEIFENDDDSYFDRYLNEVLYLFENAGADVIVFEDIDRFETSSIFERLREMNTLANIKLKNEKKKPLRFFYLLRDDIFTSKDRTKFFDFIIPVIPVVDSSNSYNKFIDLLKKNGIFERFDENFLQGLSLYIDDMRLLINICNEFLIYINRLSITDTELNYNKMLALTTYKNLFPRDFSELQLGKGFVYAILSSRERIVEKQIKDLQDKIALTEQKIEHCKNEYLKSEKEVMAAIKSRIPDNYFGQKRELNTSEQQEYNNRIKIISDINKGRVSDYEKECGLLREKICQVSDMRFASLITRDNIDEIFSVTTINEIGTKKNYNEIKSSDYFDLLKYLVRNGYIDESYSDYMTYFYENNLTRTDKIFLRSVTDRKAREYNYQLEKPEMVVARLKVSDFDQEETLNFSLLHYLLKTDAESKMVTHFMCQLKKTKRFDFIGRYLEFGRELPAFIIALYAQWINVLEITLKEKILSTNLTKQFSLLTLYYADNNVIESANIDNCLTNYISGNEKFLDVERPDIYKLIAGFELLNVSFISIDYEASNKELFKAVYQNSLYELTYNNLAIMLRHMHDIKSDNDIKHKNYTLILSMTESPLNQMVSDNISEYVDIILDSCEKQIDDSQETIIALLNNPKIATEQKERYLGYLIGTIPLLSEIEDTSLWSVVLDKKKLDYSEFNILEYYGEFNEMDRYLIDYINSWESAIDMSDAPVEFKESDFFTAVVMCAELNNDSYYNILKSMNRCFFEFGIKNISDKKMELLINANIILMNLTSLEFIRENYSLEVLLYYIRHHIEEYVDIIDRESFSYEELIPLLSENISDELKLKLLPLTNEPISIIDTNYSTAIKIHILNNNLNVNDIITLYKIYEVQPKEIKNFILEYAETNYKTIISNINVVSSALKTRLLASSLTVDKKAEISIAMSEHLGCEQAVKLLSRIGLTEYEKIFLPRHKPKIVVNDLNKLILNLFVRKKWIESFEVDANKSEYYKVQRKGKSAST